MRALIELRNVDVTLRGHRALEGVSWSLRHGEHWAVLGANGAGKSTLLQVVCGHLWPDGGREQRAYRFDGEESTSPVDGRRRTAIVSAERQARYSWYEWRLTGRDVVLTGFFDSDLLNQPPTPEQERRADALIEQLGIGNLARRAVRQMSQGELRKVLIARALVGQPRVLALDEVCAGLDVRSRGDVLGMLERAALAGAQLVLTSHRPEELPGCLTHVLCLARGRVAWQGRREDLPTGVARSLGAIEGASPHPISSLPTSKPMHRDGREPLIRIVRADISLEGGRALRDVNWEVCAGEHWMVVGPNGAGKSSLLRLILGDLHPVYGGEVRRFGLGERSSIWEARRQIGYVAAELQDRYRRAITVREVVASGFESSVGLVGQVSPERWDRVDVVISELGLSDLAGRPFERLSYGQKRRALLARALVHRPRLLLLGEPFDGLDATSRREFTDHIQRAALEGATVVLVSHHETDAMPIISHRLVLRDGSVVAREHKRHAPEPEAADVRRAKG